jgi:hypothetical protein
LRANASISCASFRKRHRKGHYLAQFQKFAQENKNPNTTMSSPLNSTFSSVVASVFGSGVGSYWESILATFRANFSAALGHPYFYLIRTTTRWSLCQLSGLSPINYSALLLECQLVNIHTKTTDGSRTVQLDRKKWIAFLERYELRGDVNGKGGCAELTDGNILHAAIFEDNQYDSGTYAARMLLLRMG